MIVDAHQHLIEPARFAYPWLASAPRLESGHDLEGYAVARSATGINRSVFVEVDVAERDMVNEAARFCDLAERSPESGIAGVVAACRPGTPGFADHVEAIAHPRLVGLRRVLHVVSDTESTTRAFRRDVASLAERGLVFDLCVRADQLALAEALVRECPDTRFVLDHCGNPPLEDEAAFGSWTASVSRIARHERVACKVSGLVNHLGSGSPPESLRRVIDRVAGEFGWERLLFGTDWPVSRLVGYDLKDWVELARRLVADRSDRELEAFFSGNARRIYRLS